MTLIKTEMPEQKDQDMRMMTDLKGKWQYMLMTDDKGGKTAMKIDFEKEIKPALMADGGDIELIDVIGDRVLVAFRGVCAGCPSSGVTIASVVEKKLREFVSPSLAVEEVRDEDRVS